MTAGVVALVALGGALGALGRWTADVGLRRRLGERWPWGTVAVNLVGSLALGVVVGLEAGGRLGQPALLALGTGFCGAFTTFSTYVLDLVALAEAGRWRGALAVAAVSLGGGTALAWLGLVLAPG